MESATTHGLLEPVRSARLIITVHGIRTFGEWQEKLERKLRVGSEETIEFAHYRYGFFTILAFLIPPFRWLATKSFRLDLLHQASRRNWSRIDIVAHSFGTHLVAWGLVKLPEPERPTIHTVILAGSVLKSSFPIREIVGSCVTRLVNDCGIRDTVLLVNQVFVLFTGMAGRVGLSGMEGETFRNRYFDFGHGGYFRETETDKPDFMSKHWLPLLRTERGIPPHSQRQYSRWQDLTTLLLNNAEPIKLACYVLPLLLALAYVNQLRINAEREAMIAESRALALQSEKELTRDRHKALGLALQAIHRVRTEESIAALVAAFPLPITVISEESPVTDARLSSEGLLVATMHEDHQVRLWNLAGAAIAKIAGDYAQFSPNGKLLATVTLDRTVRVWDLGKMKVMSTLASKITGDELRFFPNGTHILTTSANQDVFIWDTSTGKLAFLLHAPRNVSNKKGSKRVGSLNVDISSDGKRLITFGVDDPILEWNALNGQRLATMEVPGHSDLSEVLDAEFSPNGRLIVAAISDSDTVTYGEHQGRRALTEKQLHDSHNHDSARVWDSESGKLLTEVHVVQISSASFSPDSQQIVTGSLDGHVQIWNAAAGDLKGNLAGHVAEVRDARFTANGHYVLSSGDDDVTLLWDASTDTLLARIPGIGDTGGSSATFPSGKFVITKDDANRFIIWSLSNAALLQTLSPHMDHLYRVAYSPDGHLIATVGSDSRTQLWEASTGRPLVTIPGGSENAAIKFSNDSLKLITGESDAVRVWDAFTGRLLRSMPAPGAVSDLRLSPNGRFIVASSRRVTRVWNINSDQPLATVDGELPDAVSIAPNGCCLLTAKRDGTIRMWRIPGGQLLGTFAGNTGELYHTEFSPDSRLIITAGKDPLARIWSVSDLKLQKALVGQSGSILRAAFSPDGLRIVTSSLDKTNRLWDIASGQVIADLTSERLDNPYEFDEVMFSRDGQRIVTAQFMAPEQFVWDGHSGELITGLTGHTKAMNDMALSSDGNQIVTASGDETARLYRFVSLADLARILKKN